MPLLAQPYSKDDLSQLGTRILVLGPSNAGKSTLAVALSNTLDLDVVHLDQLRFLPNTNWVIRHEENFETLHQAAIMEDRWIIEGNYSSYLPARLARATGAILIDSTPSLRFYRYLKRTLFQTNRCGGLEGGKDSLKWEMIDWILIKSRRSAQRKAKLLKPSGLPWIYCDSAKELNALYRAWDLKA